MPCCHALRDVSQAADAQLKTCTLCFWCSKVCLVANLGLTFRVRPEMKTGKQDIGYLYETICTASDQHLAIWGEDSTLWVALFAKLDGTV